MHDKVSMVVLTALALVAAAATPGAAQSELADTELAVTTNPFLGAGNTWDGARVTGYVFVEVCGEPGGTNAQDGKVIVSMDDTSAPLGWASIVLRESSHAIELPMGPLVTRTCTDAVEFEIILTAVEEIERDVDLEFSFELTPAGEGDLGTYTLPAGDSVAFSVRTAPEEDEDPFDRPVEPPEVDGESDRRTPAPGLGVVLGLLGLLVAGHQRSRRAR